LDAGGARAIAVAMVINGGNKFGKSAEKAADLFKKAL
jgi:hypothetical protein